MLIAALLTSLPGWAAEVALLRNGFGIRHDSRESLGEMTRLHTGSGYVDIPTDQITSFEKDDIPVPPVAAPPLSDFDVRRAVSTASDRHLVDADLITSVIHAESGFNTRALSPKGAKGLMQLMPQTASTLGVQDAFEPNANVDAGTRYLRELLVRYNGDVAKALAAYNAGPHRVEQYRGVPPYRETHSYVARVIRDFNRKKLAAQKVKNPPAVRSRPAQHKPERQTKETAQAASPEPRAISSAER